MNDFREDELFYEPPKQYPKQKFEIDGIKVTFRYVIEDMPHFDLEGDISETGYRSVFPFQEILDKYGVDGAAREAIKYYGAEFYTKQKTKKIEKQKKEKRYANISM